MPVFPNSPNTLSVAQAIMGFGQALAYTNGSLVYSQVSLGETKDITSYLVNSGAVLEVYGNLDNSQHKAFGGKVTDEQTWYLLSLVSLDDAQAAEEQIYAIRDALVVPFQTHATLGGVGSVYHAQIRSGGGRFGKIVRNQQWVRSHLIEVLTRQEWFVETPPGVIS